MALQSNKIKKILAITAHPDDLELSFGGSVHKWFNQGCIVDNLIMCHHQPHKQYLSKTSAILGFAPYYYPLEDVNMRPVLTNDMIERIESFLNISEYDLLITHWKEDWHQDHRMCYHIGNTLRRKQPLDVWYFDAFPYNQKYKSFETNVYVDISNSMESKVKAIKEYKNVPSDYYLRIQAYNAYRGGFINKQYAECFKVDTINA